MKKIKWRNAIKLLMLIGVTSLVISDMYKIIIGYSWTWLGFITFILSCIVIGTIIDDFEEQLKKTSKAGTLEVNK